MDLKEYLAIPWRRKWVIIITLAITMVVVIAGTLKMTPTYSASAVLRIAAAPTGVVNYSDYMYADRLLNTYVEISTSKIIVDELKLRLGLDSLPEIEVETVPDTELIQITVNDQDPAQAAKVANALADILISQSTELYSGGSKTSLEILGNQVDEMENELNQARKAYTDLVVSNPDDTENIETAKQIYDLKEKLYLNLLNQYEQVRLNQAIRSKSTSIAEPASIPLRPSKPNKVMNIALGFFAGVIGGLGLAFLFENLDSTLYTSKQIEAATNLSTLGKIPNVRMKNGLISLNESSPYGEAFRHLRTNITSLEQDKHYHNLLVTSAEPEEGKSIVVACLASALAKSGLNVIAIDCDMRLPSLHNIFDLPNDKGLSNVLLQKNDLTGNIQETTISGLKVLTSGPIPENPAELLSSSEMSKVIKQIYNLFDIILIDSPCVSGVTDAAVLATKVDGVILVVSRAQSRRETVQSAIRQLAVIKANTIGVVINRAERESNYYYNRAHRKKKIFSKK